MLNDTCVPRRSAPARLSLGTAAGVGLVLLIAISAVLGAGLVPWAHMWLLAVAVYFSCKCLTWWDATRASESAPIGRSLAYLLLWPGMDARSFLFCPPPTVRPSRTQWFNACAKSALGAALFWGIARLAWPGHDLVVGWIGMVGLIFLLHFGSFDVLALLWQRVGLDARPIMHSPIVSTSLAEFWGRRWNMGFRSLGHRFIYGPLHGRLGVAGATMAVFIASGLVHDLVISLPAGAGFGLPTSTS